MRLVALQSLQWVVHGRAGAFVTMQKYVVYTGIQRRLYLGSSDVTGLYRRVLCIKVREI